MSVQRYLIAMREDQFGNGDLHKDACGDGVRFEDYAALEARCAGIERERDALDYEIKALAKAIWSRRYRAESPNWEILDDLVGATTQVDNMVAGLLIDVQAAEQERDALQAKLAAAEEALKPSAETKAEYMGEFSWKEESLDEYEEPCLRTIYVPWTTIKEIMKAIKARADLADTTTTVEVQP